MKKVKKGKERQRGKEGSSIGKHPKGIQNARYLMENIMDQVTMLPRFQACMLLAAIGDAIGYKRGHWEFNTQGTAIHKEMMKLTEGEGVLKLNLNKRNFPYSDDTVMHFATARGLLESTPTDPTHIISQNVAKQYKDCWKDMKGRAAGKTCAQAVSQLHEDGSNWDSLKFHKKAGGCGASMRAACIGLLYSKDIPKLVEISIQTGRTTHHNPIGYLASLVSAYFTALAVRGEDPESWLYFLFKQALPLAEGYVALTRQAYWNLKSGDWQTFQVRWKYYATVRKMSLTSPTIPTFPSPYGVPERQQFYHHIAINDWPGASGVDSVIIAYDALLNCKGNWEQLCLNAMLHGGDSDSTGTIAGAWFGALYGSKGVPEEHSGQAEGKEEALQLGGRLYQLANYSKN